MQQVLNRKQRRALRAPKGSILSTPEADLQPKQLQAGIVGKQVVVQIVCGQTHEAVALDPKSACEFAFAVLRGAWKAWRTK